MRRAAAGSVLLGVAALSACGGPDVTAARLERAIGPEFALLFQRQQSLLGRGEPSATASATCFRSSASNRATGAATDWTCEIGLVEGGPVAVYSYEVAAKADGCFTASGPVGTVGGRLLAVAGARTVVNPLYAFDGCFDTS